VIWSLCSSLDLMAATSSKVGISVGCFRCQKPSLGSGGGVGSQPCDWAMGSTMLGSKDLMKRMSSSRLLGCE
jgi:hypothetical protein